MKTKKIKIVDVDVGVCPYCGSTNLRYGSFLDGNELNDCYYPVHCRECHREYDEMYHMEPVFDGLNLCDATETTFISDASDIGKEIEVID